MERPIVSARHPDKKTIRAVSGNEEGRKVVEKVEVKTRNVETLKYVEKKLEDKGCMRMDRHPVDGKGGIHMPPPKQGHGGKFTWEGPEDVVVEDEAPVAIDEKDPNYVDEEEAVVDGEVVIGEVEAPKVAEEGVARVEIDPRLKVA
uniref:Uncharacterized protein n=1 Tax=Kalanchoe fedtschenkoi TaxID=63787 RepID=A0A7N0V2A4_KALFE